MRYPSLLLLAASSRAYDLRRSWNDTHSLAGKGAIEQHKNVTLIQGSCQFPNEKHSATIFNVLVGAKGALRFDPDSVDAQIGDIIQFNFLARNHTLTQSSVFNPCQNEGGFSTGFHQFNPKNESGKFVVSYPVRTKSPEYFFCAQLQPKSHCQAGMVFSINKSVNQNINPQETTPISKPTTTDARSRIPTSTTTTLTTSEVSNSTVPVSNSSKHQGNVASVLVLLVSCLIVLCC